jgi:hypothetical protein
MSLPQGAGERAHRSVRVMANLGRRALPLVQPLVEIANLVLVLGPFQTMLLVVFFGVKTVLALRQPASIPITVVPIIGAVADRPDRSNT